MQQEALTTLSSSHQPSNPATQQVRKATTWWSVGQWWSVGGPAGNARGRQEASEVLTLALHGRQNDERVTHKKFRTAV